MFTSSAANLVHFYLKRQVDAPNGTPLDAKSSKAHWSAAVLAPSCPKNGLLMAKAIQLSDHQTKPAIMRVRWQWENHLSTWGPGCCSCLFIADINRKLRPVSSMCLLTCKITQKKHILASHPVIVKTTIGLVSWWNEQHLVPKACNLCGKCRPPHSRCVKESFTEKHFKLVPLTGWNLSDFT
jgi:hypothetical protein